MNSSASQSVPQRAQQISKDTWDLHKERIRSLFIDEKKTLQQVLKILEEEKGFKATLSQYARICDVWGFKKRLGWKAYDSLADEKRKRKREGKETVIKFGSRVVQEDEIRPKKKRFLTVFEQHQREIANQRICTSAEDSDKSDEEPAYAAKCIELKTPPMVPPPSPPTESRFLEVEVPADQANSPPILLDPNSTVLQTPSESGGLLDIIIRSLSSSPAISIRNRVPISTTDEGLLSLVSRESLHRILPTVRFEDTFKTEFIGRFQGSPGHFSTNNDGDPISQLILSPVPIKDSGLWVTKILQGDEVYQQHLYMDLLLKSGLLRDHARILETILEMQESIYISSSPEFPTDYRTTDALEALTLIVKNFATELFYSAARTGDMQALRLLVHLGILKESKYRFIDRDSIAVTAAQFAIEYEQEEATKFLLQQNINVNRAPVSDLSPSLLWTAVLVDNLDLVLKLIKRGANDHHVPEGSRKISSVAGWQYRDWLKTHADRLCWPRNYAASRGYLVSSALGFSVSANNVGCFRVLAYEHIRNNHHFSGNGGHEPILDLAIGGGNHLMMKEILAHPICSGKVDEEILVAREAEDPQFHPRTALSYAIWKCDPESIKILLEYGASPQNITLEHFRIKYGSASGVRNSDKYLEEMVLRPQRDFLSQCRDRELSPVIDRIGELILEVQSQLDFVDCDAPLSDPFGGQRSGYFEKEVEEEEEEEEEEDDDDDDDEMEWTYRFPKSANDVMSEVYKVARMIPDDDDVVRTAIRPNLNFLVAMEVALGYFETIEIGAASTSPRGPMETHSLCVIFTGILFGEQNTSHFISKLQEAFDENTDNTAFPRQIYIDSQKNIHKVAYWLPPVSFVPPPDSRKHAFIGYMIEEHGPTAKRVIDDHVVRRLDRSCFDSILDPHGPNSDGKYSVNHRHKYNERKAKMLLLNLEKDFEKYRGEVRDILTWSRCISDESFRKRLCDIIASHLSELDYQQVTCLLKLALHGDFAEIVELVLAREGRLEITMDVIREAAYFSSEKAFTRVLDYYIDGPHSEGLGLEIPLLVAIINGHSYKVVKILPNADVNYRFGSDLTAIEVATRLGRLDIVAALIEAGATRNLRRAQKIALKGGHFTLQTVISQAIEVTNMVNIDGDDELSGSD
ncbi:hypothetical protein TWF718_002641 [Orbilia javanica]|uniref:Clr5 domain-containing protein n=1 Tax=Orbilia javanica TaxID=47235 RepID=A0AAN8MNR4_9PEZI